MSESRSGAYGESVGSTSGGPSEYDTRKGACHTCGETGHYSFECRASDSGVAVSGTFPFPACLVRHSQGRHIHHD
jgi:Zinc knuckle